MLTPADIHSKRFPTTRIREGYDQDEVDNFLDKVADALAVTTTEWQRGQDRIAVLERQVEAARSENPTTQLPIVDSTSRVGSVEKLLNLAQQTADKHIADAQTEADSKVREAALKVAQMIEEASSAAENLKGQAVLEAEKIRAEGLAEKQRALDALEARHVTVTQSVNNLTSTGRSMREALNRALAEFNQGVPL